MYKFFVFLIKKIMPSSLYISTRNLFYKNFMIPPVHINNVFGFDIYQSNLDGINYKKFKNKKINQSKDKDFSVINIMMKYIKNGDVCFDLGANIGMMSLIMSKLVGEEGKVYSFEPGPISYGLLLRNIYANSQITKNNIIPVNSAVTEFNDMVPLFINSRGESDNQVHTNIQKYDFRNELPRESIMVKGVSLTTFIKDNSLDKVSFIKMDTQGHEYYIFKGGKEFFSKCKNICLLVEYAPYLKSWENYSQDDFYELISSYGFSIRDIKNPDQEIDNNYLKERYSFNKPGDYTDLILIK